MKNKTFSELLPFGSSGKTSSKKTARKKLKWHPAFVQAMQLELINYKDSLEFKQEYQLTAEPLRIDLLVIKKPKELVIDKNIARIFRTDNIIEYKSPSDNLSIKDFLKIYAYANLYAAITPGVDSAGITLTFMADKKLPCPKCGKLFQNPDRKLDIVVIFLCFPCFFIAGYAYSGRFLGIIGSIIAIVYYFSTRVKLIKCCKCGASLSLKTQPRTFTKAAMLLCCFKGIQYLEFYINFIRIGLDSRILSGIVYMVSVLLIARLIGKDELRRIFVWRDIPLAIFAGVMIMYYGFKIITSELFNLFEILFPIPESFLGSNDSENIFLLLISGALFPAFTEEIFYRGIIARRFFGTYSIRKALILSALLFGIAHIYHLKVVNALYGGIFIGWLYWRYKSIWLCMFTHFYHNALVYLLPLPYGETHHPLWFDMLGLFLFGLGLLIVIVLSRNENVAKEASAKKMENQNNRKI